MRPIKRIVLPPELISAMNNDPYDYQGKNVFSVTSLISPPRQYQLRLRYRDKITSGATNFSAFLGQGIHQAMERVNFKLALKEHRLKCEVRKHRCYVSGKMDLYHDGTITDYKTVEVGAGKYEHEEWVEQLNLLAFLARENGYVVNRIQNILIYRDWSFMKYRRGIIDVPPAETFERELWPNEKAVAYLDQRMAVHILAEGLPDDQLPFCSQEETWERDTVYRIFKPERKRPIKVTKDHEEAWKVMVTDDRLRLEVEQGEPVRCTTFCEASRFCSQYQEWRRRMDALERENNKLRSFIEPQGRIDDTEGIREITKELEG